MPNIRWRNPHVDTPGGRLSRGRKLHCGISDGPGIWYPLVKRGTYVQEGMKLGYVTDYFGKVILEPRAPAAGVVLHVNAVPSLKKGDNIANLGVVASKAPL